ncbi:MAG TPA: hypothetical protein DEF61_02935 [Firmicutes bacterium]|nr:hypothetical protein [Bacillota bacterium]
MSKFYVEKYVKVPVLIEVEADDEFGALNNVAYGDWDGFEFTDDLDDWVIEGIKGNESNGTNYTTIYDEKYNEVRYMSNEVADGYVE